MNDGRQNLLDAMAVLSFVIGVENLSENIDQSTLQDSLREAVDEVHDHLQMQDKKLEKIMEVLNIEV